VRAGACNGGCVRGGQLEELPRKRNFSPEFKEEAASAFIEAEHATVAGYTACAPTVTQMCGWLRISRSGFYEWRSRPDSAAAKRRNELKLLIAKAFEDSDGTYGYRRVALQLARWGVQAGLELVRVLMRELGLVAMWCPVVVARICVRSPADQSFCARGVRVSYRVHDWATTGCAQPVRPSLAAATEEMADLLIDRYGRLDHRGGRRRKSGYNCG
jgi:hypothetical protein